MAGRRFLYLAALAFCLIFYCLFRQWLTWVLALGLLWLPVLSLLLSLPALLLTRLSLDIPGTGTPGESVPLAMRNHCKLPCTPFTTRYHLRDPCTLEKRHALDTRPLRCLGDPYPEMPSF